MLKSTENVCKFLYEKKSNLIEKPTKKQELLNTIDYCETRDEL